MVKIMIIKTNLKEIRNDLNMNQFEMAEFLGISRSSYSMWESNNEMISINQLINISNTLNVSIDYILGLSPKKNSDLNNVDKKIVGARLKEFRKENKLTQDSLANILNTNKSVICNYEKGRYLLATPFLFTICSKYKISADYLLGKTDEPKYIK